ncbi:MAG: prepilin-type N-terminal cleavage/methylation domain-containing protein [Rhodocyclaceae bacterium]|nr:prepilin-type N-terminal cleavage/methylation domain-containing protein [Rhodocyclaceae bacterium]
MKKTSSGGFTLVELMVAVGIMGVLLAIGLPQYNEYLIKGKLTEAMSLLSDLQLRQEQYYQDNRTYSNGMTPRVAGSYFTNTTCVTANSGQTYICSAASSTLGYTYTLNEAGAKTTSKNDGTPAAQCWLKSSSGTC